MGSMPGREFRMAGIVRYIVGDKPDKRRRAVVRELVRRVLAHLVESGVVEKTEADGKGSFALYRWREQKVQPEQLQSA